MEISRRQTQFPAPPGIRRWPISLFSHAPATRRFPDSCQRHRHNDARFPRRRIPAPDHRRSVCAALLHSSCSYKKMQSYKNMGVILFSPASNVADTTPATALTTPPAAMP